MYMQDKGNWRSVEKDGNPATGLYVALYKDEENVGNMIVELLSFNEADTGSYGPGGWSGFSYDQDYDYTYVQREVLAYLPDNIDMEGLRAVRDKFAVPV